MTRSDESPAYITPINGAGNLIRYGCDRYTIAHTVRTSPGARAYMGRQRALVKAVSDFRPALLPFRIQLSTSDTCIVVEALGRRAHREESLLYAELVLKAFSLGISDHPGSSGMGATCMIAKNYSDRPTDAFSLVPRWDQELNPEFEKLVRLIPHLSELNRYQSYLVMQGSDTARAVALVMALAYLAGAEAKSASFLVETSLRRFQG